MDKSKIISFPHFVGIRCRIDGVNKDFYYQRDGDCYNSESDNIILKHSFENGIVFQTNLTYMPQFSIWKRKDSIQNTSSDVHKIENIRSMILVENANKDITVVKSDWAKEAQFKKVSLSAEMYAVGSKGRSCSEYSPHAMITSKNSQNTLFDILPFGDWRISFEKIKHNDSVRVFIDGYNDNQYIELSSDEIYSVFPEYIIQISNEVNYVKAWENTQRYVLSRIRKPKDTLPVVYNSWFDQFQRISYHSLERQLFAAKEIGCDVFVVDAGWFSPGATDWDMVGDWRENTSNFPDKTLTDFANLVRQMGLTFGIWMEPERVHINAPARKEHPEWFIQSYSSKYFYPDLTKPEARNWVLSVISDTIERYGAGWIKVDCNFEFSDDPYNSSHNQRLIEWYGIIDEIADRFPDLIIEGCASGGMRTDIETLSHFQTHFLTDTVDPIEVVRIAFGSFAWIPPRYSGKWAVVYPSGNGWTPSGRDALDTGDLVLCPAYANSHRVSSYHLNFACRASMPGAFGISGNIRDLPQYLKDEMKEHIDFYKKHKDFILKSVAFPLTDLEPVEKRDGFAALQLSDREYNTNMVFVYNLSIRQKMNVVKMLNIDKNAEYIIYDEKDNIVFDSVKGIDLLSGIELECEKENARVYLVVKK
ncbi:MAG: glycoside hydrolase family 36 protein [Armatimonadota bacterium]